jgi:hypothetical protein
MPLLVAGRSKAIHGPVPWRFDGVYYNAIATHGYISHLSVGTDGKVGQNVIAFFPGYPLLLRLLHATGLSLLASAVLLSTVAAVGAGTMIAACVADWAGRPIATLAALLWAAQPTSFVLSLAYSEGLFTLFAAGCLFALQRRQWVLAGLAAAAASATRPSGITLFLACLIATVPIIAGRVPELSRPRDRLLAATAPVLAPIGILAYFWYLGVHTGRFNAWFVTENDGWGAHTDLGADTFHRVFRTFIHPEIRPSGFGVIAAIAAAAILASLLVRDRRSGRIPAPGAVLAFTLASCVLAVTTNNVFSSEPRFFLPIFALWVPLAARLVPLGPRITALVVAASTGISIAIGTAVLAFSRYPM